jgi:hypothetical protein
VPGFPYAVPPADPYAAATAMTAVAHPPGVPDAAYYPAAPPPPSQSSALPSGEFQSSGRRRYRRASRSSKVVWIALCLLLTGGLVAGGIYGAKYLKEQEQQQELDPAAKLVAQLGSENAEERDAAYAKLKEMGKEAEEALKKGGKSENPEVAKNSAELLAILNGVTPQGSGAPGSVAKTGPFPRRLLFITISKYMYLNPLTYGQVRDGSVGEDKTTSAALRMAYEWKVPNDPKTEDGEQLFILSDSAKPGDGGTSPMPMKNVVMGTYERFFSTSRDQDRIAVYFGGHALEKEGVAYIAPIEGDLDEPASLIPLAEFYEKLQASPAMQKIVIWDVCRFNPERGKQRPGSEPMTESLYQKLAAAPAGTQVVITCKPGENALEFFNLQVDSGPTAGSPYFAGSSFLESMRAAAARAARNAGKQPTPEDSIPVAEWVRGIAAKVKEVAALPTVQLVQTVAIEGVMPESQVSYDPEAPLAKRFDMPTPPTGAAPAEIASIVSEFSVPPIRRDVIDAGISDIPFEEAIMKDFKSDASIAQIRAEPERYRFRIATLAALDKIRTMWATAPGETGGPPLRDTFRAPVNDMLKRTIKSEQEFWAFGIAELELLNIELDNVKRLKEGEPKRWQAHYEYARAVLKARLAYMHEFNKLMGDVLTETLPQLEIKQGQDGYKLISNERMKSKRDVQEIADEAREAYNTLITEFKGTPWAIQAKREKSFSLGLAWQPFASGTGP